MGHVGLIAGDALFVLTDFLGQILGNFIFQGVLLGQIVGFQQPQALDVNIQVHALFN